MAGFLAKLISKKILGERLENKYGREDPFFEYVPATRLDGRPSSKLKKQRKALPPGISDHDGQVLTKVKRRAYRLDMSLCNCCGIRFGWSSLIGIIPAIGDVLDAFMAFMVVHTCQQIEGGLPGSLKAKMYANILLDFGIGIVPFIGDLADAVFRANTRNAALLEEHLRAKGKKNLRQSGLPIPAIDPSDPDEFDRLQAGAAAPPYVASPPPANGRMTAARADGSGNNGNGNGNGNGRGNGTSNPTAPAAARTKDSDGNGRGFFGFGGGRSRPHDVEMGGVGSDRRNGQSKGQQRR